MTAGTDVATSALVSTDISPTFISSDLFSPQQKGRITTPNEGFYDVASRPLGGRTWGENLTKYGGIGSLPFLGQSRARDLFVSRSHRHYSSGFSKYESNVQPYRVTDLLLSHCRINDEIVPKSLGVELQPSTSTVCREPAYFSHSCIFEVFPRHDNHRRNDNGNYVLGKTTRDDLQHKYDDIYHTGRYNEVFPDYSSIIEKRIADQRARVKMLLEAEPSESNKSAEENQEETRCSKPAEAASTESVNGKDTTTAKPGPCWKSSLKATYPFVADKTKNQSRGETPEKHTVSGLGPHWPSSDSYIFRKHFQLKEIPYPHPVWPCPKGHRLPALESGNNSGVPAMCACTSSKCADESTSDMPESDNAEKTEEGNADELPEDTVDEEPKREPTAQEKYEEYLEHLLPVKLVNAVTEEDPSILTIAAKGELREKIPDPSWLPPVKEEYRPPGKPLLAPPTNFWSEAHKRFHEAHPETIPDLRDHHVMGKKYFFYGMHASVFRGGGIETK